MTKEKAIEIITNALQADENKYTAGIDMALSVIQRLVAKIPEKHGRLIDADAIDYDDYWNNKHFSIKDCQQAQKLIDEQPTIIEAEGQE